MNNQFFWKCPICNREFRQPLVEDIKITDSFMNDIKIDHLAMHIKDLANAVNKK